MPSWYVTCPLHKSHRSCTKSMSEDGKGGDSDRVVRRLLYWVAQGSLETILLTNFFFRSSQCSQYGLL